MSNVVLRGLIDPAVKIYDLDLEVAYGQEVTITLDQYVSSSNAQTFVAYNLLLLLQGPSILPRTIYMTDVDPQTFNLRQNSVEYDHLDYPLQQIVSGISSGEFFWIMNPHIVDDGTGHITWDHGTLYRGGAFYDLASGSLTATGDCQVIGFCDSVTRLLTLRLEPLSYVPNFSEVEIAIYDWNNKVLIPNQGTAVNAVNVFYDNSTSGLSSSEVQGALDELAARTSDLDSFGTVEKSWTVNLQGASVSDISLIFKRNALTGNPSIVWNESTQSLTMTSSLTGGNGVLSFVAGGNVAFNSNGFNVTAQTAMISTSAFITISGPDSSLSLGPTSSNLQAVNSNLFLGSVNGITSIYAGGSVDAIVISSAQNIAFSTGNAHGTPGIFKATSVGGWQFNGVGNFSISTTGGFSATTTTGFSLDTPYLSVVAAVSPTTTTISGVGNNLSITTSNSKQISLSADGALNLGSVNDYIWVSSAVKPLSTVNLGDSTHRFGTLYAQYLNLLVSPIYADGSVSMGANLSFGNYRGTSLADPVDNTDAATKGWVTGLMQGFTIRPSVRVATVSPGTLATDFENGDTIDGVVLVTGDRILIKNQASAAQNGLYLVQVSGAPVRDSDVLAGGITVFVLNGTSNVGSGWVIVSSIPIVPDVTPVNWSQFSAPQDLHAGDGISISSGIISTVLASAGGLKFDTGAMMLKLDGTTLALSGSGVSVNQGALSLNSLSGTLNNSKGGTGSDSSLWTGVVRTTAGVWSADATTSHLPEGTQLYFTPERVDDEVASLLVAGTGIGLSYDDPANTLTISVSADTTNQRVAVLKANSVIGTRRAINFVDGTNTAATVTDDGVNNWVNVSISTSAEANTASNVGTGGIGIFKQKSGVDLQFYGIEAGSSKLSVSLDAINNNIKLDVSESNLTLNNIGGTLSAAKGGTGIDSSASTGVVRIASGVWSADATTSHLPEGTQLYFTPERVDDEVASLLVAGNGITLTYDDPGNTLTITVKQSDLSLGSISGTLAIGKGGTGQVTASAAFDALSPLTTKGDLVVYGTAGSRLGVGTDGQVLTADSSQTNGLKWAAAPATGLADPGGNGVVVRTSLNVTTYRTIMGTASRVSVSNGDGVSGNPTIDIDSSYVGQSSITTVGTISSGTWAGTAVAANYGGTGLATYVIGDLLYASGTTALSSLADVATGNALISGGIGAAPSWGKIDLSTHITGTLPIGNGGTGQTSASAVSGSLESSSTLQHIMMGIDSLSVTQFQHFRSVAQSILGNGGPGLQLFDPETVSIGEATSSNSGLSIETLGQLGGTPQYYGLNLLGFYISYSGAPSAYLYWDPGRDYEYARVFYCNRPGDGKFSVGIQALDPSTYAVINCDGDLSLGYVDIVGSPGNTNIIFTNITPGVIIFGILFYNTRGAIVSSYAHTGQTIASFASMDQGFMANWMKYLNPDIITLNGGTNDGEHSAEVYGGYLDAFVASVRAGNPKAHIAFVNPNEEGSEGGNTTYREVMINKALQYSEGYFSNTWAVGDRIQSIANDYCTDGTHLIPLANDFVANHMAEFLKLYEETWGIRNPIWTRRNLSKYPVKHPLHSYELTWTTPNGYAQKIYEFGLQAGSPTSALVEVEVDLSDNTIPAHTKLKIKFVAQNNTSNAGYVSSVSNLMVDTAMPVGSMTATTAVTINSYNRAVLTVSPDTGNPYISALGKITSLQSSTVGNLAMEV